MRLYGGRILKSRVNQQIISRQELRDAIVYDVTPASKYCRVKIQGSDAYIKAYYNENFGSTPEWLKPGNAVRISHPGGNKGRIEVVGHGILLPTAIPGGNVTPPAATPGDTIITGMTCHATDPQSMNVTITTGTYRIAGVTYTLGAIEMDQATLEMDRAEMTMDDGSASVVTLDAASSTQWRYDILVVGADGVVDVVKGTNATSSPVMPSTPASHIFIASVLLYPGMTAIAQSDIYTQYGSRALANMSVTAADTSLAWGDLSTTISIRMLDQYGNILSGSYAATISFSRGNGTISQGGESSTTSLTLNFSGSVTVTYTRDGLTTDDSPLFTVDESTSGYSGACYIWLLDAAGGYMFATP